MFRRWLPFVLLTAVACGSGSGDETTPTPTQAAAAQPTLAPAAPAVTWHDDIRPLMQRSCIRCHTTRGVAPSDFSTYDRAAPYADLMAAFTAAELMPPPVTDPACRDYKGSEHLGLTDDERALFTAWADDGAPEGPPPDISPPDEPLYELEDADMVLLPPVAHQPRFNEKGDEYHCTYLDAGREDTWYITALEPRLDRLELVHHIVLYLDLDGKHGGEEPAEEGFTCFHGDSDWMFLGAWAPGGGATVLPEDTGLRVGPGQRIVAQFHYFRSFEGADLVKDRSGYAFNTTERVKSQMTMLPFGPEGFTIPAGASDHTEAATYTMEGQFPPMRIWGVAPHMHVLGKSYHSWIDTRRGDETCVVRSDGWDFDNQLTYMFNDPIDFRMGDSITMQCTWDNSASNGDQLFSPPRDVSFGEGTGDEMCYTFSYVTFDAQ